MCLFREVVETYNANKFFRDLPDFALLRESDFVESRDVEEYEVLNYEERHDYLKNRGLITDSQTYESESVNYDELPFN